MTIDVTKLNLMVPVGEHAAFESVSKLNLMIVWGQAFIPTVGAIINTGCGQLQITNIAGSNYTAVILKPIDNLVLPNSPTPVAVPIAAGEWSMVDATDTIPNLAHLEGMEVMALADGEVVGPLTVSGGQVVLPKPAAAVVVGLAYQSQLQTLRLDLGEPTTQGKRKTVPAVTARVDCARGLKFGPDFDSLYEYKDLQVVYSVPQDLITGDLRINITSSWNTDAQICVQQDYPLPATVLGLIPEVLVGDTQR